MRNVWILTVLVLAGCSMSPLSHDESVSPGKIELMTDHWGIPHIFASTDQGALYGLGYVTARDRGFQMHLSTRIMQGRLSELLGDRPHLRRRQDTTLSNDRKMRTFGFYRAAQSVAQHLDNETGSLLQAYCDGVNAWFQEHHQDLHGLYAQYGLVPEPWTIADCIVAWWHVGQFFGTDATRELIAWRNEQGGGQRQGGRTAGAVRPVNVTPDDSVAVIQREDLTEGWIKRVEAYLNEHGFPAPGEAGGTVEDGPSFSHAWVLGGRKTSTGSSVLISDPQTPVTLPSLFYEYHICGNSFNARGIGVAGSPLILIGFSDYVAWGATALGADQADLFRLVADPNRPNQYYIDGQWKPMTVRKETIKVKGGDDQMMTVRETCFGPVITEFAFAQRGEPEVAVKRIPVCETNRDTIQGAIAMLRAKDVYEFDRALEGWRFPSVNSLFGDRHGNIGFRTAVAQPLRAPGVTDLNAAQDGSRSANDWQGIVPHDLMPHVINPKQGFLLSANHRPIGSFYRVSIGNSTGSQGDTIRSWRLRECLSNRDLFTPQQVLDVHYDKVDPAYRDILRLGYYLRDIQKADLSRDTQAAMRYLEDWFSQGAQMDNRTPGTELAARINTMFRIMTTDLTEEYGGGQTGLCRFLKTATQRIEQDTSASLSSREAGFINSTLSNAWQTAVRQFGADPNQWGQQYQRDMARQQIAYFQELDGFGGLNREHNIRLPALICTDGNTIFSQRAQSYTQFVPMHDPDQARTILPVGQSEDPDSLFFANLTHDWSQGILHPAPLSRTAVEKIAEGPVIRLR